MRNVTIKNISILVVVSILLNLIGKNIASYYSLPLWMDSFGTCLAAYVLGPLPGAVVGASGNLIFGIVSSSNSLIYSLTSIGIGVLVGILARRGWMETLFGTMSVSVAVTMLSVAASTPLNLIFYEGRNGNLWGDGVYEYLVEMEVHPVLSSVIGEFYVDFLDKVITLAVLFLCIQIRRQIRKNDEEAREKTEKLKAQQKNEQNKEQKSKQKVTALLALILLAAAGVLLTPSDVLAGTTDYSNYVRTVYSRENGLPCGEANDICQTRNGILWIGTYAGLYRYNGSEFKWMDEYESIRNVNCLYEDEEGRLWIGTNDSGLSISINEKISNVLNEAGGLPSNSIRSIVKSSDGFYYIGTSSGMQVLTLSGGIRNIGTILEVGYCTSSDADDEAHVAAITADGLLHILKGGAYLHGDTIDTSEEQFTCCRFGPDGLLYVGTSANHINVYSIDENNLLHKKKQYDCGRLMNLNNILFLEEGVTIVCADNGIGYFDEHNIFSIVNTGDFNNSIDNVTQDYQGNLWFTSSRMGLLRLARSDFGDLYNKAGLRSAVTNSVTVWRGDYYIGTDVGLDIIKGDGSRSVENELTKLLENVRIRCVRTDSQNHLWICSYGSGLLEVLPDGTITTYDKESGTFGNRARVALELSDGSIAAAGDTGISFIKNQKVQKSLYYEDGLSNAMILCLLEKENGLVLAGTDGDGIVVIKDGDVIRRVTAQNGLPSGVILRMVDDPDGDGIFLVTSNSLCYMDADDSVRVLEHFPYYNNYDLWAGENGKLFILGSAGIYVVNRDELVNGDKVSYVLLDHEHGLLSALTANSWNYLDENGVLYLSCDSGIFSLNMKDYDQGRQSYRMMVGHVDLDGFSQDVLRGEDISISRDTKRVEIFPEVVNYSIEDPYVSYYLEGLDDGPTTVLQSDLSTVTYTNIPSGTYTFHLSVLNHQMKTIEESSYRIVKEAEIYDHQWFMVYMFIVAMMAVAWLTWFLVRNRVQQTIELQERELAIAKKQLQMGNETILAIAKTVDAKDENTSQHSMRVSEYSVLIAEKLGFTEEERENLGRAALLHDIGKIGIPDRILNKAGRLDDEEYATMKSHVTRGAEILKDFTLIDHVVEGALYHHERYDGSGYAEGLKGEEIPLYGRIIGVADAFDAMTANRVYRKKLPFPQVIDELKKGSGKQFDPQMVDILLGLIEDGRIDVAAIYGETVETRNLGKILLSEQDKNEQAAEEDQEQGEDKKA
ncbi:MAG: HD domain-containing protein [Lachnospiraceae bacterium]|nr:HD domain-containing protein [Lachnospiraceae bacterium]